MDKVKRFIPRPHFESVLYFEDTVWSDPILRRRIQVNPMHRHWPRISNFYFTVSSRQPTVRILISNIQSPCSISCPNIKHILRLLANWTLEEWLVTLGVENQVHEMGGLKDFELLLVGWEENFTFTAESRIAPTILDEAAGYGGAD